MIERSGIVIYVGESVGGARIGIQGVGCGLGGGLAGMVGVVGSGKTTRDRDCKQDIKKRKE